jgi:hypothetical protein
MTTAKTMEINMDFSRIIVLLVVVLSIITFSVNSGHAFDNSNLSLGTRVSFSEGSSDGDFNQYDIFTAYTLPWKTRLTNNWQVEPVLDLSLGILDGNDETGGKVSTTLDMFVYSPTRIFSLSTGLGVGVMTDDEFGDVDFGGPIFFIFRAGAYYWFNPKYSIGYRFQHESNGSIYSKNPSLNMHIIEFRMNF